MASRLVLLSACLGAALGLGVTPGSPCASFCLAAPEGDGFKVQEPFIRSSDVVCRDADFAARDSGIRFKACLECLQTSDRARARQTDLYWFLYNLRYAVSTCLFSLPERPPPDASTSSCATAQSCLPLKASLTADGLKGDVNDTFAYCTADGGSIAGVKLQPCVQCLGQSKDETYLSNFMLALKAGCDQQPEPGSHLGINGTLFAASPISVADHPFRSQPAMQPASLNPGAIAGIVTGVIVIFAIAAALFFVHFQRQRCFQTTSQAHRHTAFFSRVVPSRSGWDDDWRPSAPGSKQDGHLPEATLPVSVKYSFDPRSTNRAPDSALPTHQAYRPQAVSRAPPPERPVVDIDNLPSPSSPPRQSRPGTPDSFVVRTYMTAAGHPANSSLWPPPPAAHLGSAVAGPSSPGLDPPLPKTRSKIPSISVPCVPRIRLPSRKSSRRLFTSSATPVVPKKEMQISHPILHDDFRLHGPPLPRRAADAKGQDGAATQIGRRSTDYDEVSVRSGKSALYGI